MNGKRRIRKKEVPWNGQNMKEFRIEFNCKKNGNNFYISNENQASIIFLFQLPFNKINNSFFNSIAV
jgi:hypothetical protein